MEPECSLNHSQVPATCPYPEPSRSSPQPHIPSSSIRGPNTHGRFCPHRTPNVIRPITPMPLLSSITEIVPKIGPISRPCIIFHTPLVHSRRTPGHSCENERLSLAEHQRLLIHYIWIDFPSSQYRDKPSRDDTTKTIRTC
jgi:hypothetical protein